MNSAPRAKVLVSACLLGERVRYHGGDALVEHPTLAMWGREGRLVPFCPEVAGGMSVPRPPSEIVGTGGGAAVLAGSARVQRRDGSDCTLAYRQGAKLAAELCRRERITVAILKDGSPSCGSSAIYDGSFSGRRSEASGVTTALLREQGVQVFSELQIDEAAAAVRAIDGAASEPSSPAP
jgi:uncharacterized protein YbbK (DUF523 family)